MNHISTIATIALLSFAASASAQMIIYPANGQDGAQQNKDEGECFVWARNQTGIDPMTQDTTPAYTQAAPQQQGGGMQGAARGAILGGIVGGSDDAEKGAIAGAVIGRSRQNRRNRAAADQSQQQNQQAQQTSAANQSTFNKAYGVCLQGRGYTVG
jgi:hypothetical protein